MIDANAEIDRLRQRLRFKNLSEGIIDQICDEVSKEISMSTSDILADAMSEAVQLGVEASSEDFIEEIRAVRSGTSFEVVTDSGRTDFSEPPFPMLPKLLKNAKVAKDGSLYKVIPIKNKTSGFRKGLAVTTEAALQNIENSRVRAKEEREETPRGYTSPDAMKGMDTFSAMQAISKSRNKQIKIKEHDREPVVNFRTASSKQDASSSWVHPGRSIELGNPLANINANLSDSIDRVIIDIIRKHEGYY